MKSRKPAGGRSAKLKQSNNDNPQISSLEEMMMTLLLHQELYGLEIIRCIETVTAAVKKTTKGRTLRVGSLYPILHRLEKRDLIEGRWGDEERGDRSGARRRYYSITSKGRKTLQSLASIRTGLENYSKSNFN